MTKKSFSKCFFIKNNKKKIENDFSVNEIGPARDKQSAHGGSRPAHARGERRASWPGSGFGPRPAWPRAVGRGRGHAMAATLAAAARRLPSASGRLRSRADGARSAREPRREGEPVFGAREARGVAGSRLGGRPRAVAPWPPTAKTRDPHLLGSEGGDKVRTGCRRKGRSRVRERASNGGSPAANLAGGCGGGGVRAGGARGAESGGGPGRGSWEWESGCGARAA
jgi:translation initiation factor IF-2